MTDPDDTPAIATVPRTIASLPFFASGRSHRPDLIGRCRGGALETMGGRELVERVRDVGLGLASIGIERGERIAIVSESRPEWLIADFAALAMGAITTPIYPTLGPEQIAFILHDCRASLVIVSTSSVLERVRIAARSCPDVRTIILMDGPAPTVAAGEPPIILLDDVASRGHRRILDGWGVGRAFQDDVNRVAPDDDATIVYTSGTTGTPKGVRLTHRNLVANLEGIVPVFDVGEDDVALSFLPLSHAFERIVAYVYLTKGVSMCFAESIDTLARDIALVRPTVMTGVPRVFEKLHARMIERGRSGSRVQRAVFDWAVRVAARRGHALNARPAFDPAARLADRLVFRKLRAAVGGRARFFVSGSAPLALPLAEFYRGIGMPVLEGYGMTETSPVVSVTPFERVRPGTVGPPLFNVDVRIADDGEILVRGPSVMPGYFERPEDTAAVLRDGWLHTGDVGAFDAEGFLRITDRKKDLLVTSGGKKVAPQPIEASLRECPCIAEAVLVGDGRRFVAALLVPDAAVLGRHLGVSGSDNRAALAAGIEARRVFQDAVDRVNARLAQYERIKQFAVIPQGFSADAGELTPTGKVRRAVVEAHHRTTIDALYELRPDERASGA